MIKDFFEMILIALSLLIIGIILSPILIPLFALIVLIYLIAGIGIVLYIPVLLILSLTSCAKIKVIKSNKVLNKFLEAER